MTILAEVTGSVCREPKVKSFGSSCVLEFTVVSGYKPRNSDEWQNTYVDCSLWGDDRAVIEQWADALVNRQRVCVKGYLRLEEWQDRDGGQHSRMRLKVIGQPELLERQQRQGNAQRESSQNSEARDGGGHRSQGAPSRQERRGNPPSRRQAAPAGARRQDDPDASQPSDDIPF